MVALVQGPHTGEAAPAGWQGIRQQLFGQKRERDAEDGLLTVITELQTRLALATGAAEGPLRAPAVRAHALRAVQDGLNTLVGWHRDQLTAAQAVGWWTGPMPELARDALAAIKATNPLFEGAEVSGGAVAARDVAQSVAQLRGEESDAFFNAALDGFVAMLEAVYARIGVDAPTASTAVSMRETWEVLVEELRALACPIHEVVDETVAHSERSEESEPSVDCELPSLPEVELILRCGPSLRSDDQRGAADDTGAQGNTREEPVIEAEPRLATGIELGRFRRLELVAC